MARDSSFFQAHCQLVDAHTELYLLGIDRTPERLGLAQKELDAAFRLQPDAGEAHLSRALYLYRVNLDYAGALRELQSARETCRTVRACLNQPDTSADGKESGRWFAELKARAGA